MIVGSRLRRQITVSSSPYSNVAICASGTELPLGEPDLEIAQPRDIAAIARLRAALHVDEIDVVAELRDRAAGDAPKPARATPAPS